MNSTLKWNGKMSFTAENRGIESHFDTAEGNSGPTPKEAVLNAMCACSAMDVVHVAAKMRLKLTDLRTEAEVEKTDTIPSYFSNVKIKYHLTGDQEPDKFIKVVVLSMTKYCGVSYMISKTSPIHYEIFLNGKMIYQDQAQFSVEVGHG